MIKIWNDTLKKRVLLRTLFRYDSKNVLEIDAIKDIW